MPTSHPHAHSRTAGTLLATSLFYDSMNRLTSTKKSQARRLRRRGPVEVTPLYNQTYNIASQIIALATVDGTSNFTYDNDGQLLTTSAGAMPAENFAFDASGNRDSAGYTTGTDNQMTAAPNISATGSHYEFAYDHEGNTTDRWLKNGTASTEHVVYTWDFRDRLAEVQTYTVNGASGTLVQTVDLGYDAFDHRVHQTVTNNTASSVIFNQRFIYNGSNIAAALNPTTLAPQQVFLYGLSQNEFYAQDNIAGSTTTLWAVTDHQQSVRDVVDSSGNLLDHVKYGSFGDIASQSNSANATLLLYTSQIYDKYTGLFYYNARWYMASFGKFISADPIRFKSGQTDLYVYCGDNPINSIDPTGLEDYKIGVLPKPPITWDNGFAHDPKVVPTTSDHIEWLKWGELLNGSQNYAPLIGRQLPDGSRAYEHYRTATGTDLYVDYDRAIRDDKSIAAGFADEIAGAQADIERLHDGTTTSFKVSSSKARQVDSATENWQKALGGHDIWGSGDVEFDCKTKEFKLTLKVEMEDFYNFNKGQADIATGLPDDANGRFEVLGWAKSFYSRATVTRVITWKSGSIAKTTTVTSAPSPGRSR